MLTLRSRKLCLAGLFSVLVLALAGSTLRAGVLVYHLETPNFTNGTVSSPYANVTVDDTTSGVLKISIDTNGNPAKFSDLGFNLASGISPSDFTFKVDTTGLPSTWSFHSSGDSMDGFGKFHDDVGTGNSASDRVSAISFEFDFKAGKTSEANSSTAFTDIMLQNGANPPGHFFFGLEYFPNSGNTGFVATDSFPGGGGGGDVVVPEPTSLALSGIGCLALLSLWGVRRWRAVAA